MRAFFIVLLLAIAASGMTGCAGLNPFEKPESLTREQVIAASMECEDAGMRPSIVYTNRKVSGEQIKVPLAVNCDPVYRRFSAGVK